MLLKVEEINTYLGKSHILQGVSLTVEKGCITTLLGRNGVGKSTTLQSIMGLTPPKSGAILFKGKETIGLKTYEICRLGVGYVPEERRIFPHLTVRQNLMVGLQPKQKVGDPWTIDKVYAWFPALSKRDGQKGGNLSGGEQQMLTIGRTLMGNPELLLVDEPSEGLAPSLVDLVINLLREINAKGSTILLVEHALDVALSLADKAFIMSKGKVVFKGSAQELGADELLRKRYLEV